MRNYARDAPGTKCEWTATTAALERAPYLGWIPFFRSELLLYGIKLHPYASYFRRPFTKKSVATLTGVIV